MTTSSPTNGKKANERSLQLQRIAEIGQLTSSHLDLNKLLHDTVHLIRNQLGYYWVAVFLLDATENYVVLEEATSSIKQPDNGEIFKLAVSTDSIIGWVATHEKARIASNVDEDAMYQRVESLSETRSELAMPLIARGQLLGVLDVQSRNANAFDGDAVAILQILANQIAINIDNARLFTERELRLTQTEALLDLNGMLTATMDVGEIYRRAARAFVDSLQAVACTISSWEKEANTVTTQVEFTHYPARGIINQYDYEAIGGAEVYDLDNYLGTQQLLQTHQPVVRHVNDPDIEESERVLMIENKTAIGLEVALLHANEAIGIVEIYRTHQQPTFTDAAIKLAQAMATQTAVALDNARLASEARGQVAQLSTLNRMSNALALAPSLADVFASARREIFSLIEATGLGILLLTAEKDKLDWIYGYEYGAEVDLSDFKPRSIEKGFSGYVVRTREVLLVNENFKALQAKLGSVSVGSDTTATWLGLPLIVANEIIGVLSVENGLDANAFGPREVETLKIIAGPLAIAINNLVQFEAIQEALAAQSKQRVQLQTAAEVAAAASSILDPDELVQRAVDLIRERFDLYYTGLFIIDPATSFALLRAGTGPAGQAQVAQGHKLQVGGRSLIGGATGDGQARIIQDVLESKEWRANAFLPDTRSELAIPMRVRGQITGALTVQSVEPNAFSPELISTLQTMADQLAVAIENARLLAAAEAQAQRQSSLNETSARLYRSVDVNEIIRIGMQALSQELGGATVELTIGQSTRQGS